MNRLEWLLGTLLAFVTGAIILGALLFLSPRAELLPEQSPVPTPDDGLVSAQEAYALAAAVAAGWAPDAGLVRVNASWAAADIGSGKADWSLVYYSPSQSATALISVQEGAAALVSTRPAASQPDLIDLDQWQVDSPALVERFRAAGLLAAHDGAVLLALEAGQPPLWQVTLVVPGGRPVRRQFRADNGEPQ